MMNKETLISFLEKKGIRKWFQRDNLIILILAGVLLMIIALPTKSDSTESENKNQESGLLTLADTEESNRENDTDAGIYESSDAYVAYLENRLAALLQEMDGVGDVDVMITLAASWELVVEKDRSEERSSTQEEDSEGGARNITESQTQESTVTGEDGTSPFVIKTLMPAVEGVIVVAQGAGKGNVTASISAAVQALFGIEAHKVKVLPMGEENSGITE